MHDTFLVRRLQRFSNLRCHSQCLFQRNRAPLNFLGQRLSRHQFHDEELPSTGFLYAVNRRDVGMIQRGQHTRFAVESRCAFGIMREGFRKEFDRNTAPQLCVGGLIHVAHSPRTQVRCDFVVCELGSDHDILPISGRSLSDARKLPTCLKLGGKKLKLNDYPRVTLDPNRKCKRRSVYLPHPLSGRIVGISDKCLQRVDVITNYRSQRGDQRRPFAGDYVSVGSDILTSAEFFLGSMKSE
jgi:hypothetical protein